MTIPGLLDPKPLWRRYARNLRATLPIEAIGEKIRLALPELGVFQAADAVLAFSALPGEVDLLPLAERLSQKGWFLPRVLPKADPPALMFHAHRASDPLLPHAFGMREPAPDAPRLRWEQGKQYLILVPGLLFDEAGYRLGYGKGYYDRFLAGIPQGVTVSTVGIVPEAMLMKAVPREEWDLPVLAVLTERRFLQTDA